jgi:hypothetical protein
MKGTESKELNEKQQLLLSSYIDNECSFLSRFLAERLIRTNNEAKLFIQNLKNTTQTYRALTTSRDLSVDLWDRISTRIDGEERAALYLGHRKPVVESDSSSPLGRLFSRQVVFGGLSGAAIAATVLVMISRPTKSGEILPVYTGSPGAAVNSSAFHQASLGAQRTESGPRTTMEVDWMRANGSLKIIQHPGEKSGIIWIRKRPGMPSLRTQQAINPTPTIRVLREEGLDVTPLGTAK